MFFLLFYSLTFNLYPNLSQRVINVEELKMNKIIRLDGEWDFYHDRFICSSDDLREAPARINVPGVWKDRSFGYGSYRTIVKLEGKLQSIALYIKGVSSSYRLFVNGELAAECGKPARNKDDYKPSYRSTVVTLTGSDEYEIVIEVANFSHRNGGLWERVAIGLESEIFKRNIINLSVESLLIGFMIFMSVYHFILFFIRTRNRYYITFALTSLFAGLSVFIRNRLLIYSFIEINGEILKRLEFETYYLTSLFFIMTISILYNVNKSRYISGLFHVITLGFVAATIFLPVYLSHRLIIYHTAILPLVFCYMLTVVIIDKSAKDTRFYLFILGVVVLVFSQIHDVLYIMGLNRNGYSLPAAMSIYLFLQTIVISLDFINALNKEELLTEKLLINNNELKSRIDQISIYQQRLKELNNKLIQSEKNERSKLAKNLHDSVVQLLGLAITKLKKNILKIDEDEVVEELNDIREFVESSLEISRNMLFELHPRMLYDLGLEAAINKLTGDFSKDSTIIFTLNYHLLFKPNDEIGYVIFVNLRELYTNAIKHSDCSRVITEVNYVDNHIVVSVLDDGIGFDYVKYSEDKYNHCGLFDISERIRSVDGSMVVKTKTGNGTEVVLSIPYIINKDEYND